MRSGTEVEAVDLSGKDRFTFGRSPDADVIVQHPSCSRLHCVLQFKAGTSDVFVYDCGSTHGTFVNRRQLRAHAFMPLRVGDQLRLGQSSRFYILQGPQVSGAGLAGLDTNLCRWPFVLCVWHAHDTVRPSPA